MCVCVTDESFMHELPLPVRSRDASTLEQFMLCIVIKSLLEFLDFSIRFVSERKRAVRTRTPWEKKKTLPHGWQGFSFIVAKLRNPFPPSLGEIFSFKA